MHYGMHVSSCLHSRGAFGAHGTFVAVALQFGRNKFRNAQSGMALVHCGRLCVLSHHYIVVDACGAELGGRIRLTAVRLFLSVL